MGFAKKLIVGIKSQDSWSGYSNPRMKSGDEHHLESQILPFSGTMLVKLIGETGEVLLENKFKWIRSIDYLHYVPELRQIPLR